MAYDLDPQRAGNGDAINVSTPVVVLRRSLLNKSEAARTMGLSRYHVDGLISEGELETRVVRGRTYVTAGSARRWLQGVAA